MASSSHVENLYFKTFCSFTILVTSAGMYWGGGSFEVHSGEYYCGKSFAGTFWPTDSLDVPILYSVFLHHFLFDFRACVPSTNLWKFVVVKSVCTWCSVYGRSSVHSSKKQQQKTTTTTKKRILCKRKFVQKLSSLNQTADWKCQVHFHFVFSEKKSFSVCSGCHYKTFLFHCTKSLVPNPDLDSVVYADQIAWYKQTKKL